MKIYKPNDKVNYWTIIKQVRNTRTKSKGRHYLCRCECGKEKVIDIRHLKRNVSRSCGCKKHEDMVLVICPMCERKRYEKMDWIGNGIPRKFCESCKAYAERGSDRELRNMYDIEYNPKQNYDFLATIPAEEFIVSWSKENE